MACSGEVWRFRRMAKWDGLLNCYLLPLERISTLRIEDLRAPPGMGTHGGVIGISPYVIEGVFDVVVQRVLKVGESTGNEFGPFTWRFRIVAVHSGEKIVEHQVKAGCNGMGGSIQDEADE